MNMNFNQNMQIAKKWWSIILVHSDRTEPVLLTLVQLVSLAFVISDTSCNFLYKLKIATVKLN